MSREGDKYDTELDKELRDLAILEWSTFCELAGEEMITALKICFLRRKNSSYGKIQMKLGVTIMKARYKSRDEKCSCKPK